MKCTVQSFVTSLAVLVVLISGCGLSSGSSSVRGQLDLVAVYDLDFNDPSGIVFDVSGEYLWVVSSERGGHIYKISFEGESLAVLPYEGDDMEGITMNPNDKTLWVAEERLRQILQFDTLGTHLNTVDVPVTVTNENDGLEGISINPDNEHLYVLNEKNPRKFIELNRELAVVRSVEIDFSAPYTMDDLSGLFFEVTNREFWIVSDESEKIVVTDYLLNPKRYFELDREKFEGIAVDISIGRIYLVNDEENRLYIFDIK